MSGSSLSQINNASVAYILGAGFSCGAGLPLSCNFLNKMKEVHPQYQLGKTPPPLNVPMDELFRFRTKRSRLFDESLTNNVEFWLSLVSARTLGSIASRGFTKYQMQIAIAQTIAHYVLPPKNTGFVDSFVGQIRSSSNNTAVITLNYDDLIERSCERVKIPYRYGFRLQGFDGTFKVDLSKHNGKMLDIDEKQSSMPIYKLHGSYNWMAEQENINLISDMQHFFSDQDFWATNEWTAHRFVIEPPTVDKIYAGRILSGIWSRAYDSLTSASHLVVIGYSFPENDGYVKYLLMASLADNDTLKEVTIVDPCCDDSYKSRIKWLIDLLEAKNVSVRFCQQKAEEWIQNKNLRSALS
ncbi:SIR2 family protein [Acidithiobacillus ferriphilus]|jgi:hypothetical protein|uniref:SIR2 family protein n=1 Tax=Acidithiobacillus ferriphilus TaxID=1689834 RepID=UPI001C07E77A|nr:SIR2 family protein [Acidithiobacillus ferriphilus]MBU2831866.1 hypothetical protein [Acidithiobacillus ferriphilus]